MSLAIIELVIDDYIRNKSVPYLEGPKIVLKGRYFLACALYAGEGGKCIVSLIE